MTEKGDPMLLIGLLTAEVTGGSEVIAAAEGTRAGDCFPEGGDDTEELSGLRESLLSPMAKALIAQTPRSLNPG